MPPEHIARYCARIGRELGARDLRISPQSLERFTQDPRVWPIEAWITIPRTTPEGNPPAHQDAKNREDRRLGLLRVRPNPIQPGPGPDPLWRCWTHHLEPTPGDHGRTHRTIRECPLEIIGSCSFPTDIEKMLAYYWETDHDKPQGFLSRE